MSEAADAPQTRPASHAVPPESVPLVECLFRANRRDLTITVDVLPGLREFVESLPATKATFTRREARDAHPEMDKNTGQFHSLRTPVWELLGCWPLHDVYDVSGGEGERRRIVNPNYAHAHTFPDALVRCQCGAILNDAYDQEQMAKSQAVQHDHGDDCKRYHRLEARAALIRLREREIKRLVSTRGWSVGQISTRFGLCYDSVMADYDIDKQTHLDEWFRRVGNTYAYLITHFDMTGSDIGDIFGRTGQTLSKHATRHSDYEYDADAGRWIPDGW